MQNINLPTGCLIRPAKTRDCWKLFLLTLDFSHDNRNFNYLSQLLLKFSFFCIALIILLIIISIFSYLMIQKIAESLLGNLVTGALTNDSWQAKLGVVFYDSSTGLTENIATRPNIFQAIPLIVLIFLLFIILLYLIIRLLYSNIFVVECDRRIVASVKLLRNSQKSILIDLYVKSNYRYQGIGSSLITHVKQQFSQPIYVAASPGLVSYYTRLGFVCISGDRLFSLTTNNELIPMVAESNQSPDISSPTTANIQLNSSVNNCLVRPAQPTDINLIRSFLLNALTLDFYLPFGINSSIIISLINILISLYIILLILAIVIVISTKVMLFFLVNWISWLLMVSIPLLILFNFISKFYISQKYSQFTLLEFNQKLVGCARITHQTRYSTLHHLYIDASHQLHGKRYFLQQILSNTNKPILVACNSTDEKLYSDLGFVSIRLNNLPNKFRVGAKINLLWGGSNLVHPNLQENI